MPQNATVGLVGGLWDNGAIGTGEGQEDTSPGQAQRRPGLRAQNDLFSFFLSGSAPQRAKPERKKETMGWVAMYPGRWPPRPCPGLVSSCPLRGAGKANSRASQRRQWTRLFARRQWPGVAALVVATTNAPTNGVTKVLDTSPPKDKA